jgi:hypothetical protein
LILLIQWNPSNPWSRCYRLNQWILSSPSNPWIQSNRWIQWILSSRLNQSIPSNQWILWSRWNQSSQLNLLCQ